MFDFFSVRSDSPPTRDTDTHPSPPLTADEKSALEIRRLRKELKNYIDHINKIEKSIYGKVGSAVALCQIIPNFFYQRKK